MSKAESNTKGGTRILSVDQYRGYAIFGMIFVNFLGQFESISEWFKHHSDYMSYADTIAPIFVFVVGMGFRLSFSRNASAKGVWNARTTALRRYIILTIIGIIVYAPLDWTEWWDALVDIGLSGILALPFMHLSSSFLAFAAFGYLFVYQVLFSATSYGVWDMAQSFDGGPLGPLSWVFMLLMGAVAYDILDTRDARRIAISFIVWGLLLSALGWLARMEFLGVKSYWPFSQRAMTAPYALYSTGIAFLTYLPFYALGDVFGKRIPALTELGTNALVMYILQFAVFEIHGTIVSPDAGAVAAFATFCAVFTICYLIARYLYRNGYIVKV